MLSIRILSKDSFKGLAKTFFRENPNKVFCQPNTKARDWIPQLNPNMAKLWELQKVEDRRKCRARRGLFWSLAEGELCWQNRPCQVNSVPHLLSVDTLRGLLCGMNQSFTTIQIAFFFWYLRKNQPSCVVIRLFFQARVFMSVSILSRMHFMTSSSQCFSCEPT